MVSTKITDLCSVTVCSLDVTGFSMPLCQTAESHSCEDLGNLLMYMYLLFGCSAWTQWQYCSSGSQMPTSHPDAWVQSLGSPYGICGGQSGSRPRLSFSTSVFSLLIIISPLLDVHLITASEGCGTYIHDHVLCKRHRKVNLNNQGCTKPPIFSPLTSQTSRLMSEKMSEFVC